MLQIHQENVFKYAKKNYCKYTENSHYIWIQFTFECEFIIWFAWISPALIVKRRNNGYIKHQKNHVLR